MNIIPIFIPHLGCPNDCIFCNQRHIASPTVPNDQEVRESIEKALSYTHKPEIAYYGGSFTAIDNDFMESYLKVGYEVVKKGLCTAMRISTRPDAISEPILDMLKNYGVRKIEF